MFLIKSKLKSNYCSLIYFLYETQLPTHFFIGNSQPFEPTLYNYLYVICLKIHQKANK